MIRHIVLLKVRGDVTEARIAGIFADLTDLGGRLAGILAVHSGASRSPERIERGYMHGFTVDFVDWQALAIYQDNADHKRIGSDLVSIAEGGLDGLLVFDLDTDPRA